MKDCPNKFYWPMLQPCLETTPKGHSIFRAKKGSYLKWSRRSQSYCALQVIDFGSRLPNADQDRADASVSLSNHSRNAFIAGKSRFSRGQCR